VIIPSNRKRLLPFKSLRIHHWLRSSYLIHRSLTSAAETCNKFVIFCNLLAVLHATCFLKPLKVLTLKSLLHHCCIHTTCFDQHRSSSGVSKTADETAVLPSVRQVLGCALVCVPVCPVVNDGSSYCVVYSCYECSAILETPEDDHWWSKHVVCIHQCCRRCFKFTTFKGFKKQVACMTANKWQGINTGCCHTVVFISLRNLPTIHLCFRGKWVVMFNELSLCLAN
jgi:hypothetical protein